jgi:hypothetical protein
MESRKIRSRNQDYSVRLDSKVSRAGSRTMDGRTKTVVLSIPLIIGRARQCLYVIFNFVYF